jgi:very-short-patch-repair endonuclease
MAIIEESDAVDGKPASIFQSDLSVETKLDRARTELLDLSARNRLLNIPRSAKSARTLEVVDERSDEVFRILVRENRPFTFLAGGSATADETDDEEIAELAQPENDTLDDRGVFSRHSDTRLQTRLTPAGLQKRLLNLYIDARTLEEEQGVNILFLALGTLKWVDPANAQNIRYAPLILVPVTLERGNAAEKFKLRWRQEDLAQNFSLEVFLERVHALKMPHFDGGEEFDPSAYMSAVGEAVSSKAGWSVDPNDIVLGFFSFAKFLMYRDLDPAVWPQNEKISERALIKSLLAEGFDDEIREISDDEEIDSHISPAEMLHIVDCDSSQTLAVHDIRHNRNLVIQGPPGTGKSQTIANIIASAIADGKTVLFVAEKMAALEVVKRRLDATGVGDACLELHSNKANKKAILDDLRRTWELGAPKGENTSNLITQLTNSRDELNDHVKRMHALHAVAELSAYQIIGQLARLRQAGVKPNDFRLARAPSWSPEDFQKRRALLAELVERIEDIGVPASHEWCGVGLPDVSPLDVERFTADIVVLSNGLGTKRDAHAALARLLERPVPASLAELHPLGELARRIAGAPPLTCAAFGAAAWSERAAEIDALLLSGKAYAEAHSALAKTVTAEGWKADIPALEAALADLPDNFSAEAFDRISLTARAIPQALAIGNRLTAALGVTSAATIAQIERAVAIGNLVASAPDASPEAFAADLWDEGVERAAELAETVGTLEAARKAIAGKFSDAAWAIELKSARSILASHGGSLFRFFSGEWRKADKLVKSVLSGPKPLFAELIPLLDALDRGQTSLAKIKEDDAFGRKAFGIDWRGERSAAAPLLALVAWMRSLRGIGAEPRLIVSRQPDKSGIGLFARQTDALIGPLREALVHGASELGSAAANFFESNLLPAVADLPRLAEMFSKVEAADGKCRAFMTPVPARLADRRTLMADLEQGQAAARRILAGEALGKEAFETAWHGLGSDWAALIEAAEWVKANDDLRGLASRLADKSAPAAIAEKAEKARDVFLGDFDALAARLRLDVVAAFGNEQIAMVSLEHLMAKMSRWLARRETLSKWVAYSNRAKLARTLDLTAFVEHFHDGRLKPAEAVPAFEMSYYETLLADQIRLDPELGRFDGAVHQRDVKSFVELDLQRIAASRLEVVRKHFRSIPPSHGTAVGPLGILRGEMARRRGHMPIRQLMQKAAPAVQALKPVFMMSPLSVAQFLPPEAITFDLLVMDEASQIQPVDALGAVARCKQVVVVGDPQQLPPTAFFTKMTDGSGDDEDDTTKVGDIESILGLFSARGLPKRMLRWHYRSRHQSLIAVSNSQFYENKLLIIPSPYTSDASSGLHFNHVADGIFETGASRTNPIEAKIVARAIVQHARECPHLSLGVAAFSVQQRRAIQDQLEILRRDLEPEHEAFFQAHPSEPFFIKNLENVQGDERDVIFISVGYGPSVPGGRPAMRFGPLGMPGGERRLNVLISRAKRRCEVFSSITDEDIDADFAQSRKGVFAFKTFLCFARTGSLTAANRLVDPTDGVLEEQVAAALHGRGYQVRRNVGIAGLFVDLAIIDPERPDRYILGVETDGSSYRNGRSARDRDRLRRSVLEDHGWFIHRLWSADWFQRPNEQLDLIVAAIQDAATVLGSRGMLDSRPLPIVASDVVTIEREETPSFELAESGPGDAATFYKEAALVRPPNCLDDIHATPIGALTRLAEDMVAVEGPVHIDEIVNRIRDAWGARRAGGRIQDTVERAVDAAVQQGRLSKEQWFLSIPGRSPKVRDRSGVSSVSLRRPEMLPPAEMRVAIVEVVDANFGATSDQIVQSVSRMLGFKSTSQQLRELLLDLIRDMIEEGALARQGEILVSGVPTDRNMARRYGSDDLEALIREGESESLEFKQTVRWDVAEGRVNKKLEEVVIKTIAAFANSKGGVLLIGVHDNGSVIGLEPDYRCLGGNRDKLELHLTGLFGNHFGQAFRASKIKVSFPAVAGVEICRIDVSAATNQIIVKLADKNDLAVERFFVRTGNSSQELSLSQMSTYVRERFSR